MNISVDTVNNSGDKSEFIKLPYRLHKHHPAWVAPLVSEVRDVLDQKKNPFYEHAEIELFVARKHGKVVGRIASIVDNNYLDVRKEPVGLFGFFDSIDDRDVAAALFDRAEAWLKEKGMTSMLGPTNPSLNDELGILIDAFDIPPAVKMIWNPSYYPELLVKNGFVKAMDLFAYTMAEKDATDRLMRMGELILKRIKVSFRPPDMKNFAEEIARLRPIYNDAWSQNWGFVPWTEAEFEHVANSLKQVIDPDMVFIAEADGRPVAFSLALPDLNMALKHINGRLFPFGLLKVLWYARKINRLRVVILGVLKEYRGKGIDTALYYKTYKDGTAKGYNSCEMSWILENNEPMNKAAQMMGAHKYKTYRLYQREIKQGGN